MKRVSTLALLLSLWLASGPSTGAGGREPDDPGLKLPRSASEADRLLIRSEQNVGAADTRIAQFAGSLATAPKDSPARR